MTPNGRWLNMLKFLDLSDDLSLQDGKLVNNVLLDDDVTYSLTLEFENIFSSANAKKIVNSLNSYFASKHLPNPKVFFQYVNLFYNDELIIDYFASCLEDLYPFYKDIKILNKYKKVIDNNKITIYIPSKLEINLLSKYLKFITLYFERYGLKGFSFIIEEAIDEIDAKTRRQQQMNVMESEDSAHAREEYAKRQLESLSNETKETYEAYKNKGYINIEIDDIPVTSYEVSEFKQINGTANVNVSGVLINFENRFFTSKKGKPLKLFAGILTNYKDSVMIQKFFDDKEKEFFVKTIQKGKKLDVSGELQWDDFSKQVTVMVKKININGEDSFRKRFDGQEVKRVELHAHTKMSVLDSVMEVEEYVDQAKRFGHKALAVTDHENCHILPDFFNAAKKAGIKPIAGLETNYIDLNNIKIALTDEDIDLKDATYVVFDLETTGFYINFNEIIEIGAVKVKNGLIIDEFSYFVKPKQKISQHISNITNIDNDTVYDAPNIEYVLPLFKKFIEGCILVGHNANFDADYIYENMKRLGIYEHKYPVIDTIRVARALYTNKNVFGDKELKKFNLGAVAKFLKVEIEQQHRAIHDARTTNNVFRRMLGDIAQLGITNYKDLNSLVDPTQAYKYEIPQHINILVKNHDGLKDFYKLISDTQTTHYYKYARLTNEVLEKYRKNLLIGSGCVNGEVFKAAIEKTEDILREKIRLYDYIEVQPPRCYNFLFEKTNDDGWQNYILDTIKLIIRVAKEEGKLVVATGDVHELVEQDCEFRKIFLSVARPNGGGPHELNGYDDMLDMHFRTTTEMLEEFSFLPGDLAYEIVVTNTNKINDMIEEFDLFPKGLAVPRDDFRKEQGVPSMKQAIYDLCDKTSHEMYGENIPQYVSDRLNRELDAIIGHGYFSVYYISHMLVENSNEAGYVVGSRGSVGSSFAATMMKITEVNPLVPHYNCPKCHFTAFKFNDEDAKKYPQPNVPQYILDELDNIENGFDLPEMECPCCGTKMNRTGMNIAFETFLGFTGEKCPDIDLNFSGEYQSEAHLFCQKVFGKNYAFRAGTVTTANDKTTFAYARDYYNDKNIIKRKAEIDRLSLFLSGSKKTTGQHPGGIVVVPDNIEIYDITPIQYPPVSEKDNLDLLQWRTSHYDYHSFESNLLKLDILGHDNPTILKKFNDYIKKNPDEFPFSDVESTPFIDEGIVSLFSSKDILNITGEDLDRFSSGTIGIPEFGTDFVRGMLETIKPSTYNDIIKVSGLSHGTDVWAGNAESLVKGDAPGFDKIPFNQIIGCRDDIMIYLIGKGVPAADSFKIMETVRKKDKQLSSDQIALMKKFGVPDWYIWTCQKIQYLFPKAHATAYVIDALRICWFKIYRPIYYYAVYFSVRAKELEAEVFALGKNAIRNKIQEIEKKIKNKEASNKEEALLDELKIALEMVLRGFKFKQIDIFKSEATDFVIAEDNMSLYLPFVAIEGLGENVAKSIVDARKQHQFISQRDVENRTSCNKNHIATFKRLGVFDDLPDNVEFNLFTMDD